MTLFWIILIIAICAAPFALYFLYWIPKQKKKAQDKMTAGVGIPGVPDRWEHSETTPLGARVIWNGEVFSNDAEKALAFACFDTGIRNAVNAMRGRFPTWDFNPAFVNIGILEPTAINRDNSKALKTKSGLQIAGIVIGKTDGYPLLTIIIPSQKENGWSFADYQMRTVWHEYEHFQAARSDDIEYYRWGTPQYPDSHPLYPLPPDIPEIPAPTPPHFYPVRGVGRFRLPFVCGHGGVR